MDQVLAEDKGFWDKPSGVALKLYIIIYGLTIVVTYLLNLFLKVSPIGPDKLVWFDNVCWMLSALWWTFVFAAVGNWPFSAWIKGKLAPGIVSIIVSWILGYLLYAAIYWFGGKSDIVFPIIATLFFWVVFFCFTGENWLWANLSPGRQFTMFILIAGSLTWLIVSTAITWIPPWWFPFCQFLLGSGLFAYLFRGFSQPGKTLAAWGVMWLLVWIELFVTKSLGLWSGQLMGTSFWRIGNYNDQWLLFFFVFCAFVWGVLVPARNWPFRLVRMPWGGILGCAFCTVLSILITILLVHMVGPVFADIHEAMTYGYMGVAWSFMITLMLPLGQERPYLWAGQKEPNIWE